MGQQPIHSFYIPVMGTAFTIDTPVKVAKYGISSVVSIGDDTLCEQMRGTYSNKYKRPYTPITKEDPLYRSKRITAYLNLLHDIVQQEFKSVQNESFEDGASIQKYFDLLDDKSSLKRRYDEMLKTEDDAEKRVIQNELRQDMYPGDIDVNIMTKLDRQHFVKGEPLPDEFCDALTAFRGFADSKLTSSIVFSAGFNRRLFAYIEKFSDFFPNEMGHLKKKIILKVSDFRSSLTQGRFLAKKGIWVSEHRIESGLNCGGHAFGQGGNLLGPILQDFKDKRESLFDELKGICNKALESKSLPSFPIRPSSKVTVQGGIGTAQEQAYLLDHFKVDATGWASPFLLVPEVTTIDSETRQLLCKAREDDFYLSDVSPLGVPFNKVRHTLSDQQRTERIEAGKPGSPCPKGFLVSNTEFTRVPICTASVTYQKRKIEQLKGLGLPQPLFQSEHNKVTAKTCLCEDLAAGALIEYDVDYKFSKKTTVCPGPNLAYFSKISSVSEMVGHIYGRVNLLNESKRANMFLKEFNMYIDFFKNDIKKCIDTVTASDKRSLLKFKDNLINGVTFYKRMITDMPEVTDQYKKIAFSDLQQSKEDIDAIIGQYATIFVPDTQPVV